MTRSTFLLVTAILILHLTDVLGQCQFCARGQGCCRNQVPNQWHCCAGSDAVPLAPQETPAPWNFGMQIKYDVYVWNCNPSTSDPAQLNTNVSCILDGRWSLDRLTFQLTSLPSNDLVSIEGEYTMKDTPTTTIRFEAASQWALAVPVDRNQSPGQWNIYDTLRFSYKEYNYTYSFGYGPMPHCPRC